MTRSLNSRLLTNCLVALATLASLASSPAQAHKGSDAYLDVQQLASPALTARSDPQSRALQFALSVAIKDLDLVVPMDANADGQVTWGELKSAQAQVLALFNDQASIEPSTGQPPTCRLNWQPGGVEQRSDGTYLLAQAQAVCRTDQSVLVRYRLFRDQDATHRLLVAGRIGGHDLLTTVSPQQVSALVLGGGAPDSAGPAANTTSATVQPSNRWSALSDYFLLGVHHLLEGYDHMAFLLALVLPLQLSLPSGMACRTALTSLLARWPRRLRKLSQSAVAIPVRLQFGPAPDTQGTMNRVGLAPLPRLENASVWWALLRTITAFTIGHSITLMLATFGWTDASPGWVEPVIALSIGVTAMLNLRPVAWVRTDVLALTFGMVHGFGFAGLLQEAAAPTGLLPWALAGFNLGVEAGQLIAVSAWVVASQLLVGRRWYPTVVVRGGSLLLTLLAGWWFWERVAESVR